MATYYVDSAATGTGDGSIGAPWTLAQAIAAQSGFPQPSTVYIASGNYDVTSVIVLNRSNIQWIGSGLTRPVVRYVGTINNTGTLLNLATELVVAGLVIDANFLLGNATNVATSARLDDCEVRNLLNINGYSRPWANSGRVTRSRCYNTSVNGYFYVDGINLRSCLCDGRVGGSSSGVGTGGSAISTVFADYWTTGGADLVNCIFTGGNPVANPGVRGAMIDGIIAINCGTVLQSSGNFCKARNVYSFGHTNLSTGTWLELANVHALPFNPFVDHNNLDFRLTQQAKDSQYANGLRAILASLQEVPGIVLDSLDELYPPLFEPEFTVEPTFLPNPPVSGSRLTIIPGTATTTAVDRTFEIYDKSPEVFSPIITTTDTVVQLPDGIEDEELTVREILTTADGVSTYADATGIVAPFTPDPSPEIQTHPRRIIVDPELRAQLTVQ